ncbi:MAG TPA: hypothetical protein VFF07_12975 [Actinomycetota bacterium]|nr:hypothetical protein [Actinomycetota bacterium]
MERRRERTSSPVTDPEELQRVRRLPLVPWAEGDKENFVCIEATPISGRRLQ